MERHPLRRLHGRTIFFKGALFASTALVFPLMAPRAAMAQISQTTTPQGGVVVGGSASISQAPASTTVNQSSQLAAINWQSFNVGSSAKVQFNQPDASAVALNRVVGGNLSQINGQINANGQIVLINQSGVVFGRGSQVNAESVVVSTSDIATKDFMAGRMNFTGAPKPGAQIVNNGNITARNAGLVGLVAPQVLNNGVITAQLGQVVLAGGSAFTLDLYGDRLISLDVTQAVRAVDVGGKLVPALVTNSGLIIANGGRVTLTAQDADALVTQLINAGGTIQANTVGAQTGTISVSGVGGNINIAGNLLAQGTGAGQKGGAIQALTAGTVAIAPTAVIDASGQAGGGVVAIGTNLQRAETGPTDASAPAASVVTIAQGAQIRANATGIGNGGTVTLLSQNLTTFDGAISTQGGAQGGNGGLAEISSHGVISLTGTVTDLAIDGHPGEILLDPATLIVTVAGGQQSTTASEVDSTWLGGLNGNIVLSASSLLEVLSDVKSTSLESLSLISGGNVSIDALISLGGSLEVDATGSIQIGPSYTTPGGVTIFSDTGGLDADNIYLNGSAGIDIGAKIDILAANGTVALDSTKGSITDSSYGGLILGLGGTVSGVIDAPTLSGGTAAIGGNAFLDNGQNAIAVLQNLTLTTGHTLAIDDLAPLSIADVIAPTASFISTDTADKFGFSVTGYLDASRLLDFDSALLVSEASAGTIVAGNLALFGGGDVSLTSANNTITALQTVSGLQNLYLDDNAILNIGTAIDIGTVFSFTGAGINESGAGLINVPTFTAFGVGGDIILQGANSFANFLAQTSGSIVVADTAALDIPGLVSGSSVFITLAAGKVLTVDTGELDATGPGGVLAIFADSINLPAAAAGQIQAAQGTIIVAPATANRVITFTDLDGGTGLILGPDFIKDITGQELALQLGTAASTGAINIGQSGDAIDLGSTNLSLVTTGALTQTGALTVGTLAFNTGSFLQTAGHITAADFTGTASSGIVSLATGTNLIGAFGPITAKNTIALADNEAANLTGAISTSGTILLENSGGGYTETGSGALTAATLTTGAGNIAGNAILGGANAINTIAAFAVTGAGNDISFNNGGTLVIDGEISTPGQITFNDLTAGITEVAGGFISAASLATSNTIGGAVSLGSAQNLIAAFGPITASGNILLNDDEAANIAGLISTTGVITLQNANGGYAETGAGALSAATLTTGAGAIAGNANLIAAANTIGTIGAFNVTGGSNDLALANSQSIVIGGKISAPGYVDLEPTGGITETGAGYIVSPTLVSTNPVSGNVSLANALNNIGSLEIAATGTVNLYDSGTLVALNKITGSDIFLTIAGAGGLAFANISTQIEALPGTLAITADAITIPTGDTGALIAPSGTLFVAPFTGANGITVTSEAITGTGLVLDANFAEGVTASQLVLGNSAMTGGIELGVNSADTEFFNPSNVLLLTKGNITQDGLLNGGVNSGTLAFNAAGFTQASTGQIFAGTISGTASSGDVLLSGANNNIHDLGAISASGNILVADNRPTGLVIAGLLTTTGTITLENAGGGVTETGGTIDAGLLTTGTGLIDGDAVLNVSNKITDLGAFSASGNIFLINSGPLTISGAVTTGPTDTLTLQDSTGGIFETALGSITAAGLTDLGSAIGGNVSLGGANAIGTLDNLLLASGDSLYLNDPATNLNLTGTVAAANVTLNAATISLTSGLSAPGLIDLITTAGITQGTAGSLTAGTFAAAVTGTGDITLASVTNSFSTIGDVSLHNGSFLLTDLHSVQITGTVATPDSLILSVTSIGESSTGVIDAGTLNNQLQLPNISLGGANSITSLAGDFILAGGGNFYLNDQLALILTSEISAGGGVTFGGAGVTEANSGYIITSTLSGAGKITGDMLLTSGNNTIGVLQNLTVAGTIDVADAGNLSLESLAAAAGTFSNINALDFLHVAGPASFAGDLELDFSFGNYDGAGAITAATLSTAGHTAMNVSLTGGNSIATLAAFTSDNDFNLNDLTNLTIAGALSAPTIALASPEILLDAPVTAGGSAQPGTIAVITDSITATGANQFSAPTGTIEIEPLTDAIVDLGGNTAGELDLPGNIFGGAGEIIIGSLPLGNPLGAGAQAVSIVVDAASFGAGLVILSAQTGIFDNGTLTADTLAFDGGGFVQSAPTAAIIANTLLADAAITGLVSLTSTLNQIAVLGSLDSSADINLTDGIALTVDGPVTAPGIALADPLAISFAGAASATGTISLTAGALTASAGGTLTAATVQLAPYGSNAAIDLGGTNFTGLQISQALLNIIGAGILRVGTAGGGTLYVENLVSVSSPELVLTGRSIDILGTLTGGTLLSLAAAGAISETATGNIDFATLTGFGGNVALTGANTFATLAAFSAASALALNDEHVMTIAGFVTTAGALSLEDKTAILETTGSLAAATLNSGGTTIGGNVLLTNSNTIGALGDLTLAAGTTFDLIDTGLLNIAGTVFAPAATISAGNLAIAGALDGNFLVLATPGTITETTGSISVGTFAGGIIGGAVSLLDGNDIGTITNLSAGGPIGINDLENLAIAGLISTASTITLEGAGATELAAGTLAAAALTSNNTVIDGNVSLASANPIGVLTNFDLGTGDTLALNVTGPLSLTGNVTASNAYFTASSITFAGLENFGQVLALESPGEVLQSAGVITAGTLTSIGAIGGDTELLDANTIASLGAFTIASGGTLAIDNTGLLTILGTVSADFATFSSDTIAIAGSIIGTQLALESTGDIFETTGAISEATLTSGGTAIGGILALGNGNVMATIGNVAALGGVTLNNFQSLAIAGTISTPASLVLQARGGVTELAGGLITAGTLGTGAGTISGALALLGANSIASLGNLIADGGIALNDVTALNIAGFVTTAGVITLEGKGGITETGTLDAATLSGGGAAYAGNILLSGSNAIGDLGNLTLATGDKLYLADTGFLAVSGTVFATTATITTGSLNLEGALEGTYLALGAKGTLAESTGFISVATLVSQGTIGGVVVLGDKNNKIGTLGAFAGNANILLNDGEALSLAGILATPGSLTLEDSTAGITEIGGGTLVAATLNSGFTAIGGNFLALNANTIGALGALTIAAGDTLALKDTGLLTVAGTVFAPSLTLASPTIAIAGALDATGLALESTGNIFETTGTVAAATLTSGNTDIGGFLSLANGNAITTLGGITATGNILINDGAAETIAGLVTTGQTITLEGAQSITETTGSLDATVLTSANTTIGGNVILNNQNTIATLANIAVAGAGTLALTDTGTLTLAGTVSAANADFTAPGLILDGILNDGQVLALTGGSFTEAPAGGLIAGTLTSLGTVDGDIFLTGAHNTIGNIQNFTVGTSNTFDLADNGLLTVSGPLTGGIVTLAVGSLSITSVLTAPTLALEALTGITEAGTGALIDNNLSSGGATIGGNVALAGANTIGTLGDIFLTGNFLLANTGPLILAGSLATPTGDVTFEDNAAITETTGQITAATLDSGGTTLGGSLFLANANSIGALGALTLATGTLALADATALTIAGTVFAPAATISAASLAIAGALDGTSLTLSTTGGLTETTGTIAAGTLTLPSIGGGATLLQPNAIATLAAVSAAGDIALNDLSALTLAGLVSTTGNITLQDAGSVTEIPGGTLAAAALTTGAGSIGGAALLTNGNLVGTLQNFAATGGISFDDAESYAIAGLISTPGAVNLSGDGFAETAAGAIDAATLLSTGTIQGDAVLNGANTIAATGPFAVTGSLLLNDDGPLAITGAISAQNTVGLAAIGNVIETGAGAITAAALTSDGGQIIGAAILNGANSLASIGAFTATNALLLTNTGPLSLTGPLTAGATLGLAVAGNLTELAGATITATTFDTDGGVITGFAALAQAGNQIGTISDVSIAQGFTLADARALDFDGDVIIGAPGLTVTDAANITQSGGTITAPLLNAAAQDIVLTGANNITDLGTILATGSATINSDAAAGLTLAGFISAGSILSLSSGGLSAGISQASTSTLTAANVYLDTTGALNLDGTNLAVTNFTAIASRTFTQNTGTIAAGGGVRLTGDAGFDQHAGRILGKDISIASGINATISGAVSASGALAMNASGYLYDNAIYLKAGSATIKATDAELGGNNQVAGAFGVTAAHITQPGTGTIGAGTLNLTGDAAGVGVSLAGFIDAGAASISSGAGATDLSGFISVATQLAIATFTQLDQTGGTIIATAAPASLSAQNGGITLAGLDEFAAGLNASAPSVTQTAAGRLDAAYASLTAANILLDGALSIAGELYLYAANAIDDEAASLIAGSVAMTSQQITLDGSNTIATPLIANATGDITQNTGALFAPGATLTAAGITLNGTDSFSGALDLITAGDISHTSTETLTAGTLIGSAGQTAAFTGTTDFGTIGSFIMQDSTFVLDNNNALTIIGPLAANQVSITAVGQITLDGSPQGGLFISGANEPKTVLTPTALDSVLEVIPAANGAIPSILQTGTFFINAGPEAALIDDGFFANAAATLFMIAEPGESLNITFAPAPPGTVGLFGPSVTLPVSLGPFGTGTGNMNLYDLILFSGLSTQFTGTLDNLTGPAGAGKGTVVPFPKPALQFNACPIGSVNCVILPTETLPTTNPLQNFDVSQRKRKHLAKSVVLPGVATRDF